ncbi:tubulin-like doman-containing protein [Limnospira sp. PMC 289.06]|uniref:tubulin-like doman-containing protein n=1 Tax=Limnospira sp. PMC 289.06 TaxID=2981094 RepID=UPI0028E0FF24|nr:tubulin-like doman-containing protein [Limnospira sp. PMC 289.06]
MELEAAIRRINAFKKRFKEPHLFLAYHAALPLAITPDLLYQIWTNFRRDIQGEFIEIPWIAVSDLILSSLCDEVGHELYEMDATVRQELLDQLKANPRFTEKRLKEVACFLLQYVQKDLDSQDSYDREFAESQSWAAWAYAEPQKSVELLAEAFRRAYEENPRDLMRLSTLTEMIYQPNLKEFDRLRIFARAMGHYRRKKFEEAKKQISQLSIQGNSLSIAGITLNIPTEILNFIEAETQSQQSSYQNLTALDKKSDIGTIVPTLIIGVGGTGLKVISRVRRLIVESYGSLEKLPVVAFLHIDTDEKPQAKKPEMAGPPLEDYEKFWASVTFDEAKKIKENPTTYSWYYDWLPPELTPQNLVSEQGAGQIRACGRFAFFYNHEKIRNKCQQAITRITVGRNQLTIDGDVLTVEPKLNIFVVGSISGGTGSGMLIDLGYCLRNWFQGQRLETTAIIPTPDAFLGIGGNINIQENGYAALMELNYFSDRNNTYNVKYGLSENTRIIENRPPYDYLYLTGTSNQEVSLKIETIQEMMAQQIFLDLVSDFSSYKRSIRDNINRQIGTSLDQARNSQAQAIYRSYPCNFFSFGIASIEIPVHAIRKALAVKLAADLYQWWLNANVQLPSDVQQEAEAELKELKLSSEELRNEILLNPEGKNYVVVIEQWTKQLENNINVEQRLKCTAQLPNPFAKETGKVLEFVSRYLNPTVEEYRLDHLRDDQRRRGDFLQRMQDNGEKLFQETAQTFKEKIYDYLEDKSQGARAIKALLEQMRTSLQMEIEKLQREAERTWKNLEKAALAEYNQASSQIDEFSDRWMANKENKMKKWCYQAIAGIEKSFQATLQRQSRLMAVNIQNRFLDVIQEVENEVDRWTGRISGSETKYRDLIAQSENYIEQLELVGLKLFERRELKELYDDFISKSQGLDILFSQLTQDIKVASQNSKFWTQSAYGQQEFHLLDVARIDELQYPQFEDVVEQFTRRKIQEAPANSKLYTEMDACTRFMRLYPGTQDRQREIQRLFNLSKPLIRLDTAIPQEGGFNYIQFHLAGIVGGENTPETAAQQQVPLLKKFFVQTDAIAPLSKRERHKILGTHEIAGFSLRCMAGTENLRKAYQKWRGERIQAERDLLKGMNAKLPAPVHIQKDMVFWDFHRPDPTIEQLVLIARAFEILRQEINKKTKQDVIRYRIMTKLGEDKVTVAANWEDTVQVLQLPDCREDRQEVERQLNELLDQAETESQKQQLGKQLQDFLAERLKTEFRNNNDHPMYLKEKTIIGEFIAIHKLISESQNTEFKNCDNCGYVMRVTDNYCSNCGHKMS